MPLVKGKNRQDCISTNISEMVAAGHPRDQAVAASIQHCNKIYGGKKMKDAKKEIESIKQKILEERVEILQMLDELYEEKEKFIQGAIKRPGSFTAWCKRNGYGGVNERCIQAALKSDNKRIQAKAKLAIALRGIAKKRK